MVLPLLPSVLGRFRSGSGLSRKWRGRGDLCFITARRSGLLLLLPDVVDDFFFPDVTFNRTVRMDASGRPSVAQAILLATSSAATAILYAVYRHKSKVASSLKGAKKVNLDQDLKTFLMEAPGKCVPYAVIEGAVRSVKETLSSQFVENCKGVVQRLTLHERKMVWNPSTHLWNESEKTIHQRTNAAPFDLAPQEGRAGLAVRVVRPLEASELSLETVYEKFHPSVQSFTDVLGHYLSGERPKGVRETEEMLKVGSVLTGVGELALDAHGGLKLQPPKDGLSYFLTALEFDPLLRRHEASARVWRILTVLFGVATCALVFFLLHKQYRRHQERRQRQTPEINAAAGDAANVCIICLSSPRSCVFLDCGHVCACDSCYRALPKPARCPLCRQTILRVVPLYNS